MAARKFAAGVAALMAPWAADAQQNAVTLYGVVDLSIAGFSTQERGTAINMQSGVQSGSRWGLRGSEDLGNGLRANFQLESGFLATNGNSAQGRRLFGRAAWVGVSGGFGDLRLGRQTSVSSATLADYDAFLASYLITGAQTALLPYNANRADNTVSYWSPSVGGLRAGVDASLDYDAAAFGPRPPTSCTAPQWCSTSRAIRSPQPMRAQAGRTGRCNRPPWRTPGPTAVPTRTRLRAARRWMRSRFMPAGR